MPTEKLRTKESMGIQTITRPGLADSLGIKGHYEVECYDKDGRLKWKDGFENVVTTLGMNVMLDSSLAGSAYTVTGPFLGLISSVGWSNLSTTISSGSYNNGTGVVSLTTASAHGLSPGDTFTLTSAAGTGSVAAIDGTFLAGPGTSGTTLNFTIVTGLTMTVTGGNLATASGTRINDTMASHANWTEAGGANAPTFSGVRPTLAWSAASGGTKATASSAVFNMTGNGTIEGGFIVFGSGAVSTVGSTAGTLLSGGGFSAPRAVINGDTVNVSYSLTL